MIDLAALRKEIELRKENVRWGQSIIDSSNKELNRLMVLLEENEEKNNGKHNNPDTHSDNPNS
jgi:hypothetical protein